MKKLSCLPLAIAVTVALTSTQAAAQSYPMKPIRLIVPLAPGGGNDRAARLIAAELGKNMGQQVVVDNRPGGGTIIASELVAQAPADGYTLYMISTAFTVAQIIHPKLPFDSVRDFAPISRIATAPGALVVHPSLPVKTVKDLIALSKRNPGGVSFSSSGVGGGSHLAGELFNLMADVQMLHVPYKGASMAASSVLSGETSLTFASPTSSMPHIKAGRLRLVALTTPQRWPLLPDTPTIAESGLREYSNVVWYGLAVRSAVPAAVQQRLHQELATALQAPVVTQALTHSGSLPALESPESFQKFLSDELKKLTGVVKRAGLSAR